MQEGSLFSTPSPAFTVCRFFDDGHSDWCEVIPHCSFDLHFSNDYRFLTLIIFCHIYHVCFKAKPRHYDISFLNISRSIPRIKGIFLYNHSIDIVIPSKINNNFLLPSNILAIFQISVAVSKISLFCFVFYFDFYFILKYS